MNCSKGAFASLACFSALAALSVLDGCGARTNLACDEVIVVDTSRDVYLVVDRSASMARSGKWSAVESAVTSLSKRLEPHIRLGLVLFPATTATNACAPGALAVPPMNRLTGDERDACASTFLGQLMAGTFGSTPLSATLDVLREKWIDPSSARPMPALVLVTDGGPNCNPDAECDAAHCIINLETASIAGCTDSPTGNCCTKYPQACLDEDVASAKLAELARDGLTTHVIGLPGSEAYVPTLDALAVAGGAPRPVSPAFFPVSEDGLASLDDLLVDVVEHMEPSCTVLVRPQSDPETLRVFIEGVEAPRSTWRYADGVLRLTGEACSAAKRHATVEMRGTQIDCRP